MSARRALIGASCIIGGAAALGIIGW